MASESSSKSTLIYGERYKHKWRIDLFSKFKHYLVCDKYVKSKTFSCSNNTWYLRLHPNGYKERKVVYLVLRRTRDAVAVAQDRDYEVNIYVWTNMKKKLLGGEAQYMFNETTDLIWEVTSEYLDGLPNDSLSIECEIKSIKKDTSFELIKDVKLEDVEMIAVEPITKEKGSFADFFNDQKYCDFTLCVGDKTIGAHKVILAARCPVFERMFENDMVEKNKNKVYIKDIDYDVLLELLRFIYTGNCTILDTIADRMIIAAEKYGFQDLKNMCEKSLSSTISVKNATNVLILAELNNADKLKYFAINFIQCHISEIMEHNDWNKFVQFHPQLIKEIIVSIKDPK